MPRLNYDEIADRYDEPSRDHVVDPQLVAFLRGRTPSFVRVLDIGCGTGKQLAANRERFPNVTLVGLDRYRGMLRVAQRRCSEVAWLQGDGVSLPLASESFDYVTNQFSYPHIGQTAEFIREVFRVCRPGGRFVLTNIDPWAMPGWFVYRFFPEAFTLDKQDFVPVDQLEQHIRAAGFENIAVTREDLTTEESLADFQQLVQDRHRMSQLMALSDEAYQSGLNRIEQALADMPMARSEFERITITADRSMSPALI